MCVYPGAGAVQLQSVLGRVCEQHQLHLLHLLPAASRQDPGRLLHTERVQVSPTSDKDVFAFVSLVRERTVLCCLSCCWKRYILDLMACKRRSGERGSAAQRSLSRASGRYQQNL